MQVDGSDTPGSGVVGVTAVRADRISLISIIRRIKPYPYLLENLSMQGFRRFITHGALLRPYILIAQRRHDDPATPPNFLPTLVQEHLAHAARIPLDAVQHCWTALRDLVWAPAVSDMLSEDPEAVFRNHGIGLGLAPLVLSPPVNRCTLQQCRNFNGPLLRDTTLNNAVVYTLRQGARVAQEEHTYCPKCSSSYYPNFCVRDKKYRVYYMGSPPRYLLVGGHQYVEDALVEHWVAQMLHGWMSAANCARIYNATLADACAAPFPDWQFSHTLRSEHVWDAFVIAGLLRFHREQGSALLVPHEGSQVERMAAAMEARNQIYRNTGLPHIRHTCDLCTRHFCRRDGSVSRVLCHVVDGVTIGFRCCGVHNCTNSLDHRHDDFCAAHAWRASLCRIDGCELPAQAEWRTCANSSHRALEQRYIERYSGGPRRLDRARLAAAGDSESLEEFLPTSEPTHAPLSEDMERLVGRFKRNRTHNEQVIVGPCGIIIAHGTFWGAEGLKILEAFLKHVYSRTVLPDHIIYDNNCGFKKYLQAKGDTFFSRVGLTVDAFHFNCKHKVTDDFCKRNCDARDHEELMTPEGGYYFNSSICEQTNVWFAGYNAILREMSPYKYAFFLDEMVIRKNEIALMQLARSGHHPAYL